MIKLFNKIKSLTFGEKVCEILFIMSILIYMYMLSGGGLVTSSFSFMGVIITAGITAIYLIFFKKNYILLGINIFIAIIIFIQFASLS